MTDEHKGEDLKGRAKEAAGALSGDDELKREGKVDQASASVKESVDRVADRAREALGGKSDK